MKLLIQIIAILVVFSTISICVLKPEMHKTVLVYNSDYKLIPNEEVKTETQEIPVMEMPAKPVVESVKKEIQTTSVPKTQTVVKKIVQTPQKQVNTGTTTHNKQKTTTKPTVKQEQKTIVKQPEQKIITEQIKQPTKKVEKQIQEPPVKKILTQQEEEIAWNVWRSNLQNKIMQDVRLPVLPTGIVFRFTFNVDKYGKITNIYTYSDNSAYTPYAIQYIAPVIRSYQGKSILNFPEGSARISTEFKGGWKISSSERLSSPKDYNDYEKVTKVGN